MKQLEIRSGVIKPVECAKEGFELIKDEYWILFAITLVAGMIGGVTFFIAMGAMTCGMFGCFLRKIDGQRVVFDDLWKGMQYFVPGLIVTLFVVVPIFIVYGMIYVPIIMAAAMGGKVNDQELLTMIAGAFAVDFVFIVIMVCVHTLLMFSYPLIVDRGLGAFSAMKTSARAVLKNMVGVVGLLLVNFALALAGELAFCVGIYLVIPIIIAANVVAYRKVFPRLGDDLTFTPPSAVGEVWQ